jgi:hypothetical protein
MPAASFAHAASCLWPRLRLSIIGNFWDFFGTWGRGDGAVDRKNKKGWKGVFMLLIAISNIFRSRNFSANTVIARKV